jgi:nucleoid DNA-binding protein
MSKSKDVEYCAENMQKMKGITKTAARGYFFDVAGSIQMGLEEHGSFKIPGVGKLEVYTKKPTRRVINGKEILVQEKQAVRFSIDKTLLDRINAH